MKAHTFWKRYRLKAKVMYEWNGTIWMATCSPMLAFGYGKSKRAAREMFYMQVHDRWQALSRSKLSPLLKRDLAAMRAALVKRSTTATT